MGLWIYEVTYLYQKCFNLEHCQTLQCFSMFFPWGFATKTREQHGCVSKIWRPSLKSRFVLAGNECCLGPSCWDKRPQQKLSYHPSSIPSLIISKIQSKKDTNTYPIMNINIAWFPPPNSGVVPENSNVKGPVNLKFAVYIGGMKFYPVIQGL